MSRIDEFTKFFTDREKIEVTIERLVAESRLTRDDAERLRAELPEVLARSENVLFNLAVHFSIGALFAFDIIPLPLGTISRCVWVIGSRAYYEIRRDARRKIHSIGVLGISAIPWLGYFAYLLPLKRVNEDAAYLFANHVTYHRSNISLDKYLEGRRGAGLVRRIIVPARLRAMSAE